MKVGVLASHPIQYQAPIFRELARHVELVVFFAHRQTSAGQAAAGYGVAFEWDVDLLEGYDSQFLDNIARQKDTGHFFGCNTPSIKRCIAQGGFDAFIVTGWNLLSYWQAVLACRRTGTPVLVRGDSQLATPRGWLKETAKSLLYPWLLRLFNGFLVVGRRNREYLLRYGVQTEAMFFSPHCIDAEWFAARAARADRLQMRASWQIGEGRRIVLFVGRFVASKRVQDLLQALQLLRDGNVAVTCLLAGDGPLRDELQQQTLSAGVDARFCGFCNQSELPPLYALADVLVLPSDGRETWGLVVNEALACGTPVVVADSVGCSADLAADGSTGAVYPAGDVAALAQALMRVLGHPPDKAAIHQWVQTYSVQATVAGMLEGCRQLMKPPMNNRG